MNEKVNDTFVTTNPNVVTTGSSSCSCSCSCCYCSRCCCMMRDDNDTEATTTTKQIISQSSSPPLSSLRPQPLLPLPSNMNNNQQTFSSSVSPTNDSSYSYYFALLFQRRSFHKQQQQSSSVSSIPIRTNPIEKKNQHHTTTTTKATTITTSKWMNITELLVFVYQIGWLLIQLVIILIVIRYVLLSIHFQPTTTTTKNQLQLQIQQQQQQISLYDSSSNDRTKLKTTITTARTTRTHRTRFWKTFHSISSMTLQTATKQQRTLEQNNDTSTSSIVEESSYSSTDSPIHNSIHPSDIPSLTPIVSVVTATTTASPVSNKTTFETIMEMVIVPLHASEVLQCPKSVINFVQYATDSKDECEGLINAFDDTCRNNFDDTTDTDTTDTDTTEDDDTDTDDEVVEANGIRNTTAITTSNTSKGGRNSHKRMNDTMTIPLRVQQPLPLTTTKNPQHDQKDSHLNQLLDIPLRGIPKPKKRISNNNNNNNTPSSPNHIPTIAIVDKDPKNRLLQLPHDPLDSSNEQQESFTLLVPSSSTTTTTTTTARTQSVHSKQQEPQQPHFLFSSADISITKQDNNDYHHDQKRRRRRKIQMLQIPTKSEHLSIQDAELDAAIIEDVEQQNNNNNNIHSPTETYHQTTSYNGTTSTTEDVMNQQNETYHHGHQDEDKENEDDDGVEVENKNDDDQEETNRGTCCASIVNVYHELCNYYEDTTDEKSSDTRLFILLFVLALCGIVKSLIRHYEILWLPEAAGCILVGVLCGCVSIFIPHRDISFDGNWFLRILVPPIIFEAALSINKKSFIRHILPIVIFAVFGTLFATVLTAMIVHYGTWIFSPYFCSRIPFVEALVFGALISSIDPIAVLSVLSSMGMTDTDTIYVLIFGESLLNDGVAIVLFDTLVDFLDENLIIDQAAMKAATLDFIVIAVASVLVGIVAGWLSTVYFWTFYGCQTPLVEMLMFFVWALLPYYVCDGLDLSGIVGTVAVGFCMDFHVVGDRTALNNGDVNDDDTNTSPEDNGGTTRSGHSHHTQQQQQRSNHNNHASNGNNGTSNKNGFINQHQDLDSSENSLKSAGSYSKSTSKRRRLLRRPLFNRLGHLSTEARTHINVVVEIVSTGMETAIFAYLGFFLFSNRYHWNFVHVFISILACSISRGIMIPSLSTVSNCLTRIHIHNRDRVAAACDCGVGGSNITTCTSTTSTTRGDRVPRPLPALVSSSSSSSSSSSGSNTSITNGGVNTNGNTKEGGGGPAGVFIDKKMQIALWFAGLRGAMSFALVESIPLYDSYSGKGTRFKPELKAMTSAAIFFTMFLLGGSTYYMMQKLGIGPTASKNNSNNNISAKEEPEENFEMTSLMIVDSSISMNDDDDDDDDTHNNHHSIMKEDQLLSYQLDHSKPRRSFLA